MNSPASSVNSVVFVSEVESNLGFSSPLLTIADALVRLGKDRGVNIAPVFFLRDPIHAGHEVVNAGYCCLPAPTPLNPYELISRGGSYAATLLQLGFAHRRDLARAVNAWDSCFEQTSPQLVVTNNSPVAGLAARGRYNVVAVGNGFTLPPRGSQTFPSPSDEYDAYANQLILFDVINAILQERNTAPIAELPDLLGGEERALLTIDYLDPFRAQRNEQAIGPILGGLAPTAAVFSPDMFLVLPSIHPGLSACVRAAERCGVSAACFAFGPESVSVQAITSRGGKNFAQRPNLCEVMAQTRVVMSADFDVIQAAVVAGRPQIILPGEFQDSRPAADLTSADVALKIKSYQEGEIARVIEAMMTDPVYVQSAQELARRIAQSLPNRFAEQTVAERCMEFISSREMA